MAYFVAFYSYKGGVGRTLALANVAYSMARSGKRVVLIDMDLEAPALHGFPEFALKGKSSKKGFIEYASAYSQRGTCPSIKNYVHPCRESPGFGELWVMSSGTIEAASYQKKLGELSWRRLHPKKGTPPLAEGLRRALEKELDPHYVLIDSRTGFSDIGGLSTHLLADMIVLVFNLTRECIEGSIRAYNSFVGGKANLRAIQLVASPIPPVIPSEGSLIESRIRQAEEHMPQGCSDGREVLRILYDPSMVLSEELAVQRSAVYPAAEKYDNLRKSIQRSNKEDILSTVEEAHKRRSEGRWTVGLRLLQEFVEMNPDNVEGHMELGNFLLEAGRVVEASSAYESATKLDENLAIAHRKLGEALIAANRVDEALLSLRKAQDLGDKSYENLEILGRGSPGLERNPVDLVIYVTTEYSRGEARLRFRLHSPSGVVGYAHYEFDGGPKLHAQADYQTRLPYLLEDLEQGRGSDAASLTTSEITGELESLGHALYKLLFPRKLREAYREFRSKVSTILIISDDASIPWEMVKPYESHISNALDDDFLCCQFELTRWLPGISGPSPEIAVERIALISAEKVPGSFLSQTSKERESLAEIVGQHPGAEMSTVTDATYEDVDRILRQGRNGLIHFVGHSWLEENAPEESGLVLSDGRTFRPRDLHGARETQLRQDRPFVFFNSCSRMSGLWASRWIGDSGCSGLLIPQWSVSDYSSHEFARAFFSGVAQGETISQAVREARLVVRRQAPQSTAWLAYAVYAHPNAQLRLGSATDASSDGGERSSSRE